MPKLAALIFSRSLYFIKQMLLPFSCHYIPDLQSQVGGTLIHVSRRLPCAQLRLPLTTAAVGVSGSKTLSASQGQWLPPRHSLPPVALQPLQSASSATGPTPAGPSQLSVGRDGQAFFLHYHFHRLRRKGGRGRNGLQLAKNFLIVSYANSFRLSGPQYNFRHSAWRQSCD